MVAQMTCITTGKQFSVYFNWNRWNDFGEVWNLNANDLVNDWNYGNCFLSRNYMLTLDFVSGVCVSRPRFQPKSILPISASGSEI